MRHDQSLHQLTSFRIMKTKTLLLALIRDVLLAAMPFDEKRNLPSLMLTIGKTHKLPSTFYSKHRFKYEASSQAP
jgi:hypothetical protein